MVAFRQPPDRTNERQLKGRGMSVEYSGADYLRRLKADQERPLASPSPAPATVRAALARAPDQQPNPAERRRSPRYNCEGSAEFRVEGSDVRTWGTLTDISVHGCYIEMTATSRWERSSTLPSR
jgi:hypothetical protein